MARGTLHPAGNLPAELTSLVGRRAELAEVRRLWSGSRLVTITGPGGVGKTRLALQVGRAAHAAFPDGVWLVALDDVTQPDLLTSTVAAALGEPGLAGTGSVEVADGIGDRQMLLILDNCEHVIDACAKLVAELLAHCPNLRVLATSREALRVEGEVLFAVPPLSLPGPREHVPPGAGRRFDAVALFVERATAANPAFALTPADERVVLDVCAQLDGLPLAIELAAAGSRFLPLEAVAEWAQDPPAGAALGHRTGPARHRTLHATMSYSYQLCSPPARILWARLSVFRGGADLDAIDTVCGGNGLRAPEVRSALLELVDQSVVVFDGTRYRMLETIRQFGAAHLRPEERRVRRAHRDLFAALAVELERGWFGPDQPALLRRVLDHRGNVRAALEFCLGEPGESGAGLRLASALWSFWAVCAAPREGRMWLDRLLDADDRPGPEQIAALWVNGCLTALDGDLAASRALLDRCREEAAKAGDRSGLAHALVFRGQTELLAGQADLAITHLEEAVRRERELGDDNPYLVTALVMLGAALCPCGRLERAAEVLEEARSRCSARREQLLHARALVLLGLIALLGERVADAVRLLKEALHRAHAIENRVDVVSTVEFLAWAALAEHDAERGARLMAASEVLSRPIGRHLLGFQWLLRQRDEHLRQARDILGPRAFEAATQAGQHLTDDEIVAEALGEKTRPADAPAVDLPLTAREREIAELVAAGKTNKEIAAELVISRRTADAHVQNILAKLGFSSRTQIVALLASMAKANARLGTKQVAE